MCGRRFCQHVQAAVMGSPGVVAALSVWSQLCWLCCAERVRCCRSARQGCAVRHPVTRSRVCVQGGMFAVCAGGGMVAVCAGDGMFSFAVEGAQWYEDCVHAGE